MKISGHFVTANVLLNSQWSVTDGKLALENFCQAMRQEAGCILAQSFQDNNHPRRFILWEHYETPEDHQRHFTLPHTQAFIQAGWVNLVDVVETTLPLND